MTERPYPPASPPPVFGRTLRAHVARHTSVRQELLRSLFHSSEPRCGGRSSQRTSALRLPPRCCFTVLGYEYYPFSAQHGGYGVRTQRGRVAVSLACKVLDSYWLWRRLCKPRKGRVGFLRDRRDRQDRWCPWSPQQRAEHAEGRAGGAGGAALGRDPRLLPHPQSVSGAGGR